MLQLQIAGTDKVLQAFNKASKELQRNTVKALKKAGNLVANEAKKNISGEVLKVQSGTLRSSVKTTDVDEAKLEVHVGTNVIYGPVHEFGATIPAHDIVPRNAKALRFKVMKGATTKSGKNKGNIRMWQGYIFAKKVHIPSITLPPRPWLGPAFEQAHEGIRKIFREATGDAIEGMKN